MGFPENPSMAGICAFSSAPFPLLSTLLPPASLASARPAVQSWPFFGSGISHCCRFSLPTPSRGVFLSYLFCKLHLGGLAAP